MVHLGDITKMSGYTIPPVDVITFGSPCQDLSIAGKRAGMAGERSGLLSEAVRIIREMRYATFGAYPKYAVWENVPGAFSSNKGEDFHAVLQSLCRVIDPDAVIPRPTDARGGLNGPAPGQFWQTTTRWRGELWMPSTGAFPNVACASRLSSILQVGVPEKYYLSRKACEGILRRASRRGKRLPSLLEDANRAFTLKIRSGCEGGGKGALVQIEKSATLSTLQDQTLFVAEPPKAYSFDSLASNSMKSSNPHSGCHEVEIAKTLDTSPPDPAKNQGGIAIVEPTFCIQGNTIDRADTAGANGTGVKEDVCYTLNTIDRPAVAFALDCRNMTANEELSATLQAKDNGGQSLNYINPVAEPLIYDARGNGDGITSPTMTGDHNSRVTDYTAITLQGDTVAGALLARDYKGPGRADSLGRVIAQPIGADLYNGTLTGDKAVTLTTATGQGGANTGPSVIEKIIRWIVRRLTPTECERLQGYPDGWTDLGEWIDSKGKTHKDADTPRYKALGNSIALPQWYYVLGGIADRLPEDATLGSLFDGIGGFPYVWAQLHAGRKQLCVWASEIEEFPIAVTKKWFPEVEDGKLF